MGVYVVTTGTLGLDLSRYTGGPAWLLSHRFVRIILAVCRAFPEDIGLL